MITKRKTQLIQQKSKQKIKTIKQTKQLKQTKKVKKEPQQKLSHCASKRNIKTINHSKQLFEDIYQQNENYNRMNIPTYFLNPNIQKIRQNLEQQGNKQHQFNLKRSASTGGIKPIKHARKSLSPGVNKQAKDKSDIKQKYSSKQTVHQQKQKNKDPNLTQKLKSITIKKCLQPNQKQKMVRKKSQKLLKNHSHRLKTQTSSKLVQFKQRQQKTERISQKKLPKQNKSKNLVKGTNTKVKAKSIKIKQKQRNSIVFSDVSFHDPSPLYSVIMPKENFYVKIDRNQNLEQNKVIRACITIQRHFRGYLTRKYIQQSKYMIYCVIKIQKFWRGYICRKKIKKEGLFNKRNLSIQNSLITIKDFSQQPKQERLKNKSFKFGFDQSNSKKQNKEDDSSSNKIKNLQQQKYINMLQQLLQQQGLQERFKQKIRLTLGKQKYVKNKINSEIVSQKSFNSPRQMKSPKANMIVNSPSSWNKPKQPQLPENNCTSPRNSEISETVFRRINSPAQNKSVSNSKNKRNSQIKTQIKLQVSSFQTFQFKIVDFLRENPDIKEVFLEICKKCEQFRTYVIMTEWNKKKLLSVNQDNLEFLYCQLCPDIFSSAFRQELMRYSQMKVYLQENNYLQDLWTTNENQRDLYQGFIKCIFDGFAQAIYQNYKKFIVTNQSKGRICIFEGHQLFQVILMNSLTSMQQWSEMMCGVQIPVDESHPKYNQYCQKNSQRLDLMIQKEWNSQQLKDHGAWKLWRQLSISQIIFQQLICQMYNQFFI